MGLFDRIFGRRPAPEPGGPSDPDLPDEGDDPLDYDEMLMLDAEDLAEGGVLRAYEELQPELKKFVETPEPVTETLENDVGRYVVHFRGEDFPIYGPGDHDDSWIRGTVALFQILNAQLEGSEISFYAMYGGNDLGGFFLKPETAEAARAAISKRSYWPWLPDPSAPNYGDPG